MKKNNISIDIINFGEEALNTSKLEAFMEAIGTETSHLVTIPPGNYLLSDMVLSSPVLMGEDGAPPPGLAMMGAGAGGDNGFEFGIDPSLDPELALALRMSLEEENARQAAEAARLAREAEMGGLESVPEEGEKKDGDEGGDNMQIDK
jgi:26S proteasome regulatory subunit N10